MLREGSMGGNEMAWTGVSERRSWQDVDRALRDLARRRGALDAEEAQLLCVAVEREIWRAIGKASLLEYLEDVLGYSPRAAKERVRVALALAELPELADALATGELAFSAIRELTRVATPETQHAWREAARGQSLRQIEQAVSGRTRGDLPTDPPDPDLEEQLLEFKLRPAVVALFRDMQKKLAAELGDVVYEDNGLFEAVCRRVLDGGEANDRSGRARYSIMTFVCEACGKGWREGAGVKAALDEADLARAECDAQRLGSDRAPERAVQDVPPMVQRFVKNRDGDKCCVPACRASQHLEIHHVVPRAEGGTHKPDNLTLLCDGHHRALHERKLTISGKAPALDVRWTYQPDKSVSAHVPSSPSASTQVGLRPSAPSTHVGLRESAKEPAGAKLALARLREEAKQALITLRFSKTEASAAIDAALAQVGDGTTLEQLLFESLRRCPRPSR